MNEQEEEWEQITTRHGDKDLRVTLLRECLPYLEGEMIRRTGHEFDTDADATLRDLIRRVRAQIGEERP